MCEKQGQNSCSPLFLKNVKLILKFQKIQNKIQDIVKYVYHKRDFLMKYLIL
jgi:hypothetical protein